MENPQNLTLPVSTSTGDKSVESSGSIVIVGANGSGKTRLGAWIEIDSPQKSQVHRVSAQKSLRMPNSSSPKAIDAAKAELLYGYVDAAKNGDPHAYKIGHRWGREPVIHLLDDFGRLMVYLFSDHYEKSSNYLTESKSSEERIEPPETMLDTIKRIWENVLPHRELVLGGGKVETSVMGQSTASYNAAEMSDGERVIFYLAGQCLAAPKQGIIVIDEPELHLHRSIQTSLWNQIELERPDCLFVYLTHDLEFAASRGNSRKIWLKSFNGKEWDWHLVPDESDIPEEILLNVLGSRKPVLFVEGDKDSLDNYFYTHLYPEHSVTPCGGCSQVISATRSFGDLKNLHTLQCSGVVDRDFRTDDEVIGLRQKGVFVLEVSEIENLLLIKDVMREIASEMLLDNIDERIQKAMNTVMSELDAHKEALALELTSRELNAILSRYDKNTDDINGLKSSYETMISSINIDSLMHSSLDRIQQLINDNDYEKALKLFNNKGLIFMVAPVFDMNGTQYRDFAKRLIASKKGKNLRNSLGRHIPTVQSTNDSEVTA